jgi:hypothetical protein
MDPRFRGDDIELVKLATQKNAARFPERRFFLSLQSEP